MKYLFLLYKMIYNDNKYCHYKRRCMIGCLFLLYKKTYNDIKYFYYTRRRIIKIFNVIIQEDV